MTEISELFGKDCKAAIIKMLQKAITNKLKTNKIKRTSRKRQKHSTKKEYNEEPNVNFRTEEHINRNRKLMNGCYSRMEWSRLRKKKTVVNCK